MNAEPIQYGDYETWKKWKERFPNCHIWGEEWFLVTGIRQRELEVMLEIESLWKTFLEQSAEAIEEFELWKEEEEEEFEYDLYWSRYEEYWDLPRSYKEDP